MDVLFSPIPGAQHREVGGVEVDVVPAGSGRVKRLIYSPGFRWSANMKDVVRTEFCQHAHVGFLAHGSIEIEYHDGCRQKFTAPQAIAIEPGHDGWVVGSEPAVVIEFDFESETARRFGLPDAHRH